MPEDERLEAVARPEASHRGPEELHRWLSDVLGEPVSGVELPAANGMSSETVLFEAGSRPLVARIAPEPGAMPVFPGYDLAGQARVMRAVAAHSAVPVPEVLRFGPDFLIMTRSEGDVPPDVMPYNFGSWVTEATAAQRAQLQRSTIGVLAELHAIDPGHFDLPPGGLAGHVAAQREYYAWVGGGSPLIERGFAWLAEHWPEPGPTVFTWGDARIGNIMYRDFTPAAVLDWEMAALLPAEVDLGWLIYLHRFFEDLAGNLGLPGLPELLRRADVAATYAELAGHQPADLDFYTCYAALRHAIIMYRIGKRAIHFGEATAPDDPDDLILHRAALEAMLAGHYWDGVA